MYSRKEQLDFQRISNELLEKEKLSADDVQLLRKTLVFHEWNYYVANNALITDDKFDNLFDKLKNLENRFPQLITPDSPTQRVANDLRIVANSVTHISPMLSLANSYNSEDLRVYDKQIKKLCSLTDNSNIEYSVEPKFDGGSVALLYENDLLVRAATRGNGLEGEEITANMKTLPSIPLRALFSKHGIYKAELRGEAVISNEIFDNINRRREKENQPLFANSRNAASGGLRMKNPNDTRKRGIETIIFQISYAEDKAGNRILENLIAHSKSIEILDAIGFKTPQKELVIANNIDEVIQYCNNWEKRRDQFAYETDGIVVKVNKFNLQNQCGATQHHPRWAIAYKFKAKQAHTKLLDVEYQVGKIGNISPVAKLQEVHLAGVNISSVSLHNEEFIKSKDLRIGDTVVVERAGDVIPYIVKPILELRTGEEIAIDFPTNCPINTSVQVVKLVKEENEAAWRCQSCLCGEQTLQKLIFHVSKEAMDIDGLGKSYVEKFYRLGWIKDISDIYNLPFEKIEQLEGFGEKSTSKLKKAIQSAKDNPIHKLLHSLSIHHLGKKASKLIAHHITHVLDLEKWDEEKFIVIKDIGPKVAQNVISYFSSPLSIEILHKLEKYGVNLSQKIEDQPRDIDSSLPMAEKTILFTGTLQSMSRKKAHELAKINGAKILSAVSNNLDILVAGKNAGSKLNKARKIDTISILTEDQFLQMVSHA